MYSKHKRDKLKRLRLMGFVLLAASGIAFWSGLNLYPMPTINQETFQQHPPRIQARQLARVRENQDKRHTCYALSGLFLLMSGFCLGSVWQKRMLLN